ncbi:ABC transporter permease [Leuconostoc carnosum]|uniref:ABC transporter permease n=1 Tax=Leuconostoc carnosum TaxID=1252 RepID=UPI00345C9814
MQKIVKSLILGQKAFMVTIAILTLLSSLTMITVLTAYQANVSQYQTAYRTHKLPDILVKQDTQQDVAADLKGLKNVKNVSSVPNIITQVEGKDKQNIALLLSDDTTRVNVQAPSDHEIILASYLESTGNFKRGDTIHIGNKNLIVKGFYEDQLLGSPLFKYKQGIVSQTTFNTLVTQKGSQMTQMAFVDLVKKPKNADNLLSDYHNRLKADLIYDKAYIQKAYTMLPTIVALVIILAAIFLFGICQFVIRFALVSGIAKDRKKIATFKTLGMSGRQVKLAYVSAFLLSNMAGLFVAILASFWTSNVAFKFFWHLNGFTSVKHIPLNIVVVLAITLLMLGLSMIIILLSLKETGNISPASAFQDGQSKSKQGKFNFDLTKNSLPLQIRIAFKDYVQKIGHYMTFTLVIGLFVFLSLMIATLNQGFKGHVDSLFGLPKVDVVMRTPDHTIRGEALQQINTLTPIKSSGYIQETKVLLKNEVIPVHRYSKIPSEMKVLSGHTPKNQQELLLSSNLIKTLKLKVGQKVHVKTQLSDNTEMTIVGTYQTINNLGKEAYSLVDLDLPMNNTYINLKSTGQKDKLLTGFHRDKVQLTDTSASSKSLITTIQTAVKLLASIILILTLVISGLFVYLVSYLTIETEKRQLALKKMLGFTNVQLKVQYLFRAGFALALGIGLSLILDKFIGSFLLNGLVDLGGLTQFTVQLPLSYDIAIILLLVVESSLIVISASRRITKIKIGDFL